MVLYWLTTQTLCWTIPQQMIMDCIKLFVTISRLIILEKWMSLKLRNRLECKINYMLLALLPNKLKIMRQGPVTSGKNIRSKRAIPALAII